MAAPGEELHDIVDPQPWLPGIEVPLWFWITVAVVAFGLLASLLFVLLRRKDVPAAPTASRYSESRHALEVLREHLAGRTRAEVATDASMVLRHYLADTLEEPALFETHEEFLARDDALSRLPTGARERLAPLLGQLAEWKYGVSGQDDRAAAELVDSCLEVLQGVESTRERQVA